MLQLFNENVMFYQEKSFMFFQNARTTYWTFLKKIKIKLLMSKTSLHGVTPNSKHTLIGIIDVDG